MDYDQQVEHIVTNGKFGDLIEFDYPIGFSHWGVYDEDGYVVHFAVPDEGPVMSTIRNYLQAVVQICGDLLLGETRIRRMRLAEINVPKGAHVLIRNNGHALTPSAPEDMRQRLDALLDQHFQYQLFTLNCEHFATFIRYGKSVCNQIPTRPKNVECEGATAVFQGIVDSKQTAEDDAE
ncbi:phospholipase A and acyltransferase 4-like [Amphiprion ocellaris]|uniref:phospholipase A and acyltransferase 4-like n=1 Tax=Amphiprion ocellaris TaxID=80972 RepID=UPI000C317265|nr:phospholipase A and acyltransferase 4-like [Amphiprion ocellaris]